MTSLLALLVMIMTLPGPLSWACMLKSGSVQCCCISIAVGELGSSEKSSCCHAEDADPTVDEFGNGDVGNGDFDNGAPQRDSEDGDEPCDCGGDDPEQPSVEPKDGGDGVLAASIPTDGMSCVWPPFVPQQAGADHETQERCTGPPLYVLYETFLI